ncbi:DUF4148 domain-containing protein [Paraburkholderia kirstenboschensis]|uniref:DUF4148 domain-containing protein n=1 Tax=Paraburkholderia kirstenboschensis TaxID=1245436 RepID=A0ABZ0E8P4_9BURK|nr:DUF4148 domain-containing protein [Paraburkholderia kirstenboschensis]WOD13631.1 DUF4148 domain-containing protein [Paraburkholderia kirstenboschensis]
MKLLTSIAVTALGLVFGANAFAQTTAPELTRAEVRAQLAQAEADGLVPTHKNDYPPSATTIARNQEIYAIQHKNSPSRAMASAATPADSGGTSE